MIRRERGRPSKQHWGIGLFLLLGVGMSSLVHAASVDVRPSVATSLTYSDNVRLAPHGEEEDDLVLVLRPAVSVRSDTQRAQLNARYAIDALFYENEKNRNEIRQSLLGNAHADIVDNTFYVDGSAWVQYQPLNPTSRAGLDNIAVSEAVGKYSIWTVAPTVQQQYGTLASVSAGLRLDLVEYDTGGADSFAREWFARAVNGPALRRLEWSLSLSNKDTYYNGGTADYSLATGKLDLRYLLATDWRVAGTAGYEKYDYAYDPLVAAPSEGEYWTLGLVWSTTRLLTLEAGVGERFFGSTRYGTIMYDGGRGHLEAKYTEEVSSGRDVQRDLAAAATSTGGATSQPGSSYIVESTEVFIRRKSEFVANYKATRLRADAHLFEERRNFQNLGTDETLRGAGVALHWLPSSRTTFSLSRDRQIFVYMDGSDDTTNSVSFSAERKISPQFEVSLLAGRQERSTTRGTYGGYVGNSATLQADIFF